MRLIDKWTEHLKLLIVNNSNSNCNQVKCTKLSDDFLTELITICDWRILVVTWFLFIFMTNKLIYSAHGGSNRKEYSKIKLNSLSTHNWLFWIARIFY